MKTASKCVSLLASVVVLASLCAISASARAQGAPPNRLLSLTHSVQRLVVADTVVPRARAATDLGPAPAAMPLHAMTLRFNQSPAQQAALAELERAQQDPASASYHQWLSPEQYGARFGLSASDLATVTGWLASQGFSEIAVARSHSFVTFSGTAGAVASAFGTTLHRVSESVSSSNSNVSSSNVSGGESHITNLADPTLPAALAGVVSSITGLNDFHLKPHAQVRSVDPKFTSSVSGAHYLAPGDFYTIYDLTPQLNNSINGTGISIGVMGQTDISLSDAAAFRRASGLPANAPSVQLYGTDPGTLSTDIEEAMLDVEWAGAVAPSASIVYVNATDVIAGSLTQAIDNNVAPILTISYGNCELGFGSANLGVYNQLFRQANVQGQTIVGPSGDSGATDCDFNTGFATGGLAVDFPASSPNVTGVGGTMFAENGGVYFSSTNDAFQGSALSYIPEAVWNESVGGTNLSSSGGGVSTFFTKPSWQVGPGVPNDFSRDVPDVSFAAAAGHDGYLFCSRASCLSGFRNASGNLNVVGGTSVSTPAFAGILALLEQRLQARIGNANPNIYALANSTYASTVFHDVTSGSNASPCTAGSINCPNGGTIGYNAGAGYDLATGWGSIDVNNLIADWPLVTPVASGSALNASSTAITFSAASVTAGATVTVNVTVQSATSGISTTPSGTVQLLVDTVPAGVSASLVNGSASLAVSTGTLSSGAHTVAVAYLGDATYAGSKGASTLDIVSATSPDFTLSPFTSSVAALSGASAPGVTFTVTPTNGFTGQVNFTASTTSGSLAAGYSFSVTPVLINSTSAGTTVLTLQAYQSQAQTTTGFAQLRPSTHAEYRRSLPWAVTGGGATLAAICLIVVPRRRRRVLGLLAMLVSIATLSLAGCSTSSNNGTPAATITKAAPGSYTIIVTASAMNTAGMVVSTHNANVTFVVQ